MVSIKFTTLLLGLFATCFITATTLRQRRVFPHLGDAVGHVTAPEGILAGKEKRLFGGRKMLVDGRSGDLKSSGAVLNVKCDENRGKGASRLYRRRTEKEGGFVAFGADYHFPKQHPPRHN